MDLNSTLNKQTNKVWGHNDLKFSNPNCPSVRKRSTSTYQRNPFWFMRRVLEDKHIKKFRFSRTPRGAVNGPEKTPLGYLPFTCQLKNCSQIICHFRSILNQVQQLLKNDTLEKVGRIFSLNVTTVLISKACQNGRLPSHTIRIWQ